MFLCFSLLSFFVFAGYWLFWRWEILNSCLCFWYKKKLAVGETNFFLGGGVDPSPGRWGGVDPTTHHGTAQGKGPSVPKAEGNFPHKTQAPPFVGIVGICRDLSALNTGGGVLDTSFGRIWFEANNVCQTMWLTYSPPCLHLQHLNSSCDANTLISDAQRNWERTRGWK